MAKKHPIDPERREFMYEVPGAIVNRIMGVLTLGEELNADDYETLISDPMFMRFVRMRALLLTIECAFQLFTTKPLCEDDPSLVTAKFAAPMIDEFAKNIRLAATTLQSQV